MPMILSNPLGPLLPSPRISQKLLYVSNMNRNLCLSCCNKAFKTSTVPRQELAGEFLIDVLNRVFIQDLHEFGIAHQGRDITRLHSLHDFRVLKYLL